MITPANKLKKNLVQKVGQTIIHHQLVEANDKVLVGLSGGKDSYVLLDLLSVIKRKSPVPFSVSALHIIVEEAGYVNDLEFMQDFCNERKMPLTIHKVSVDLEKDKKKSPCFVCSWHRRKALFNYSKEHGFSKLALGHHMDDAVETMLMNMMYHGSISSLPFSLTMFKGRMQLIRPMLELEATIIKEYAVLFGFPEETKRCSYADNTKRAEMKEILKKIYTIHRLSKKNLFRAPERICREYLPLSAP
jgi:tRNA 2-thiocytidine biosynthesis protein TtcA